MSTAPPLWRQLAGRFKPSARVAVITAAVFVGTFILMQVQLFGSDETADEPTRGNILRSLRAMNATTKQEDEHRRLVEQGLVNSEEDTSDTVQHPQRLGIIPDSDTFGPRQAGHRKVDEEEHQDKGQDEYQDHDQGKAVDSQYPDSQDRRPGIVVDREEEFGKKKHVNLHDSPVVSDLYANKGGFSRDQIEDMIVGLARNEKKGSVKGARDDETEEQAHTRRLKTVIGNINRHYAERDRIVENQVKQAKNVLEQQNNLVKLDAQNENGVNKAGFAGFHPKVKPYFQHGAFDLNKIGKQKRCKEGDVKCAKKNRRRRSTTTTTTSSTTTTLDRDDPYVAVEFPIYRAASATTGMPWPLPASFMSNESAVFRLKAGDNFVIQSVGHNCQLIDDAITRYRRSLAVLSRQVVNSTRSEQSAEGSGELTLDSLDIRVKTSCSDAWPSLNMSEWYALMVTSRVAVLYANEVWGALRGLETFRQLVYPDSGELHVNFTMIEDHPRFKHRGILMDTARHYLSPKVIKENIEAMSQNKFNVLHWHIVDDQSFPFQSQRFPELSDKGAFHPSMVYTHDVIKDISEFARRRGIRVVPEFDTPGHTRSWGHSHPELLADCQHNLMRGPLDPTKNHTYEFLRELFDEVSTLFRDQYLHLGGDEASFVCWERNEDIRKFLDEIRRPSDFHYLEKYYFDRLIRILKTLPQKPKAIVWQEVFDNGIMLSKDSVIAVWKGNEYEALGPITSSGYRVISTSCWYLNYIKYSTSWHRYYLCDPQNFNYQSYEQGEKLKEKVIGGEACMWAEFIDDTNLMTTLWPRALAVAERLWSPETVRDVHAAEGRFEEQNCRMRSRGLSTSPENGPSSCLHTPNYDKIWIKSFIPEHPEWDMQQ